MSRCNVLLLGDSISLGYRNLLRQELSEYCKIMFPREQGKGITDLYRMIYEWDRDIVNGNRVNLVYWNAGLWDVVRIYGDNPQTSLETYIRYVKAMNYRLRKLYPEAKICFATTTAVMEDRYDWNFRRMNADIDLYNNECCKVIGDELDYIDDLHEISLSARDVDYRDATHFNYFFNKRICEHVCGVICTLLDEGIQRSKESYETMSERREDWLDKLRDSNSVRSKILIWGFNDVYKIHKTLMSEHLEILGIIDKDKRIQGIVLDGKNIVSPETAWESDASAIVSVLDDDESNNEISDFCLEHDMVYVHYRDLMIIIWSRYEKKMLDQVVLHDYRSEEDQEMVKYIGINIKENLCNLDCEYCYLSVNPKRRVEIVQQKNPHDPRYIRYCLRRERLGGSCLIGITGTGETMLADKIQEICMELLKEGHYLHIVTNGTCVKQISDLIERAGVYAKHIIFKLSFHYSQLKKRNLLEVFSNCVNRIEQSAASYTVELMPHDEIVDMIPEIQEYSLAHFGAYPHLTIGRDDRRKARLLTSSTAGEYFVKWSIFESPLFDLKRDYYLKEEEECQAGRLSCYIDLFSGKVSRCYFNENLGNIYLDDLKSFDFESVKNSCPIGYCYNCHIFAPLNILKDSDCASYTDVRDRTKADGSHWIKEDMRRFLSIKLQ